MQRFKFKKHSSERAPSLFVHVAIMWATETVLLFQMAFQPTKMNGAGGWTNPSHQAIFTQSQ